MDAVVAKLDRGTTRALLDLQAAFYAAIRAKGIKLETLPPREIVQLAVRSFGAYGSAIQPARKNPEIFREIEASLDISTAEPRPERTAEPHRGTPAVSPGTHPDRGAESPLGALAVDLYLTEEFLSRILSLLDDKGQVVFYGPPGTGKTFVARKLAEYIAASGGTVEKVQFHPSYAYEDFVEGYRPRLVEGQVTYEIIDGPLKRMAAVARERPDYTHVLMIDELNRANVSKVLGELLFLLEYREEELKLQYSDMPFALPPNLQIIATMNTSDRSVALIDAALRRRFHFVPFFPDRQPIDGLLRRWLDAHHPELEWVADVVDCANRELSDRNAAIGPSHFLKPHLTEDLVEMAWNNSVLPYLEEHFYGNQEQLRRFDLARLRAKTSSVAVGADDFGDDAAEESGTNGP